MTMHQDNWWYNYDKPMGLAPHDFEFERRVYVNSHAVGAFGPESSEAFHAYPDFVLGTLRGAIVL